MVTDQQEKKAQPESHFRLPPAREQAERERNLIEMSGEGHLPLTQQW